MDDKYITEYYKYINEYSKRLSMNLQINNSKF